MRLASVALVLVLFAAAVAATQPEAEAEAKTISAAEKQEECDKAKAIADLAIKVKQLSQEVDSCVHVEQVAATDEYNAKQAAFIDAKELRNAKRKEHDGAIQTLLGMQDKMNAAFCVKVKAENVAIKLEEEKERQKCECQFQTSCMFQTGATDCDGFGSGPFRTPASGDKDKAAQPQNAGSKCGKPNIETGAGTYIKEMAGRETQIKEREQKLADAEAALAAFEKTGMPSPEEKRTCTMSQAQYVAATVLDTPAADPAVCKDKKGDAC